MTLTPFPYSAPREGTDRLTPPGRKPGALSRGHSRQSGQGGLSVITRVSAEQGASLSSTSHHSSTFWRSIIHSETDVPIAQACQSNAPPLDWGGDPEEPVWAPSPLAPCTELPGASCLQASWWLDAKEVPLGKTACGCAPISAFGGWCPRPRGARASLPVVTSRITPSSHARGPCLTRKGLSLTPGSWAFEAGLQPEKPQLPYRKAKAEIVQAPEGNF